MAAPLLVRKSLVLAEVEAEEGIDQVPTVAGNELLVSAVTPTVTSEQIERNIFVQHLSRLGSIQGITTGQLTFTTELRGIGTAWPTLVAPLREDPLFRSCGMSPTYAASSAFYEPVSDSLESCSIYTYLDGTLFILLGSRGNFEITAETGQYGNINWTMQGMLVQLTTSTSAGFMQDAAFPTPTYQSYTQKPPPVLNVTTDIDSESTLFCLQSFTMNMNNEIQQRVCMSQGGGVKSFMLTGRNPQGTMNPEAVLRGATGYDFWYKWQEATEVAFSLTIGSTAKNQVVISAPAVQYGVPAWGERNGMRIFDIPLMFNSAVSAGNDEVRLTYS